MSLQISLNKAIFEQNIRSITVRKTKKQRQSELSKFEKQAVAALHNGEELGGKNGILAPLIKHILEASLC